ncbi:MAG: glycosyltransferase [Candidatus Zixiibacteriota bacterium]
MTATASPVSKRPALSRAQIADIRVRCQRNPADAAVHNDAVSVFLEAGLNSEALPLLRRLVDLIPTDTERVRQLAAILSESGDDRGALDAYRRIADLFPEADDAQLDLLIAACRVGDAPLGRTACERRLRLNPDNYEALNDLAVLEAAAGNPVAAAAAYDRCLSLNPEYEKGRDNALKFYWDTGQIDTGVALIARLRDTLGDHPDLTSWQQRFEAARARVLPGESVSLSAHDVEPLPVSQVSGRRIMFVTAADTFLRPIVQHLGRRNDVRVEAPRSSPQLAEAMRWADLVWFEWCDAHVVDASHQPKTCPIVCRLHSYEAFTDIPGKVNWRNVDRLILVNNSVGEILDRRWAIPTQRTIIHNGIDPERFPFVPPSARTPGSRRVASVGYINYKKNPSLLLQTLKTLHSWDPGFRLDVAGTHQDPRIEVYMDHLLPRLGVPVEFHGWVADMPAFYAGMNYVLSTSLFESFHYSIAEGMLSGCLPLIHSWKGADEIYPRECIFDTPDEALRIIQRYDTGDADRIAAGYRRYVSDRYNWHDRLQEIDAVLRDVLTDAKERTGDRVSLS